VAVLATGNELVPFGEKPAQGQIRNSNGPMIVAAAERAGAETIELGIARDNRDELTSLIEQGLAADVLVLSGGVSVGTFDLVPGALQELGVEQVFHKVAIRPGKPLWFGVKDAGNHRAMVFGLPGNPVSSFVCFEVFVRPAIAALAGRGFFDPATVQARLNHEVHHSGGRAAFLPARVTFGTESVIETKTRDYREASTTICPTAAVDILPWQGSADLATLARANGLARLSGEKLHFAPGMLLDVLLV
jgi:molybdopterin molybdotransferase